MKRFPYKTTRWATCLVGVLGCALGVFGVAPAHAVDYRDHPALVELVDAMVAEDGYPRAELAAVLGHARIDRTVIEAMDRPYESKPWPAYRALFINAARIRDGVAYWNLHAPTLQRASAEFGVPAAVIVALLGVETHYGTRLGGRRVLDSLVTLAAQYPRRSAFFAKELRVFLNTARADAAEPQAARGSFAAPSASRSSCRPVTAPTRSTSTPTGGAIWCPMSPTPSARWGTIWRSTAGGGGSASSSIWM